MVGSFGMSIVGRQVLTRMFHSERLACVPADALSLGVCWRSHMSDDGAPLLSRGDIRPDERSLWRYDAGLPIKQSDAVAYFGEGMTPLLPGLRGAAPFLLKIEYLMPSGSFKDRGSAVLANALRKF